MILFYLFIGQACIFAKIMSMLTKISFEIVYIKTQDMLSTKKVLQILAVSINEDSFKTDYLINLTIRCR